MGRAMVGAATTRSDRSGRRAFGQERHNRREAIAKIKERVLALETTSSFEERFHEVKNGFEIPQSEVLVKIERLQRQVDDLKRVADPDARFRELAERVGELEKTTSLEARFAPQTALQGGLAS
jgi:hypothetical protein